MRKTDAFVSFLPRLGQPFVVQERAILKVNGFGDWIVFLVFCVRYSLRGWSF